MLALPNLYYVNVNLLFVLKNIGTSDRIRTYNSLLELSIAVNIYLSRYVCGSGTLPLSYASILAEVKGIEPSLVDLESTVLPLHHTSMIGSEALALHYHYIVPF